jgi:hypothetical protein
MRQGLEANPVTAVGAQAAVADEQTDAGFVVVMIPLFFLVVQGFDSTGRQRAGALNAIAPVTSPLLRPGQPNVEVKFCICIACGLQRGASSGWRLNSRRLALLQPFPGWTEPSMP